MGQRRKKNPSNPRLRTAGHLMSSQGHTRLSTSILLYQLGPALGKLTLINNSLREATSPHRSFLMDHTKVRHSLLYYGLLVVHNA